MRADPPRRMAGTLACLFFGLTLARAADVVPDLDRVEGIKQFSGPPAARELLKRNGFVVVPRFYHQVFSPYIHEPFPPFITTDSLHRTFHVIFEEQIKRVETALAKDVAGITKTMLAGLPADAPEAGRLARAYFLVAQSLLSGDDAPADAPKEVAAELALIRAAARVAASPLFGYAMDYTQFKPRGFYTETPLLQRYFRAMSWYGNAAFRIVSDRETRAAMLIAERFAASDAVRKAWEKADRLYTHLIAPADDLAPLEYCPAAALERAFSAVDPLPNCRAMLGKLRDPKINSMVIPPQDMPRWRELSKGMRFFGKRYLPDSEVFMRLTLPAVPGRGFPCGLDAMAANGSARAAELLRAEGHFARNGYEAGFAKAQSLLSELKAAPQRSHYVNFLRLAETLWGQPPEAAAPFMKTPAYGDKGLLTALAAWASTRHTWQLQAKQSVTYAGERLDAPPKGYVEPNIAFFQRLEELVAQTLDVLKGVEGIDVQRLQAFRELVVQVRTIAEKQLAGKPLTGNEASLLDGYGPAIARLSYFEGNAWLSDENLPWMSLVADVHTEHLEAKTLEVATGGGMPIFVTVPYGGKLYLMVGGVYSYYEFLQPLADRLTDEAWRRRCERGDLPPMPAWTASFVPGRDVEALLEKLRQGEVAEDLLYVQDPRIAEALKKELAPGGRFAEGKQRELAIELYGLKAGRDAMPFLLALLDSASVDDRRPAERALASVCDARDVSMLKGLLLAGGKSSAYAALGVLAHLDAWAEILDVFQRTKSAEVKRRVVYCLEWRGVKDATPALLAAYRADAALRQPILEALARIWDVRPNRQTLGNPPSSAISTEQEEKFLKEVRALVLDALKTPSPLQRDAVEAVAALQIEDAVPILDDLTRSELGSEAISALGQLQSPKAGAAIVGILKRRVASRHGEPGIHAELIDAIRRKLLVEAWPTLIELLDDTRDTRINNQRVCDMAMRVLADFRPEGPGYWQPQDAPVSALDRQIEAWRLYLKIHSGSLATMAHHAAVAALADKLLELAEMREKDRWAWHPDQSIRWVAMARKMIAPANEGQSQRADALLPPLVRKEVKCIAEMMGRYHANFGKCPPEAPGQWERVVEEKRYIGLDHTRFDKEGRLCDPWGRPYRYLNPARHSKQPAELYSFGPDGKDDDGAGDDIASWKQN